MEKEMMLLTPKEAADMLKVSLATIYRYLNDEKDPLPALKLSSSNIKIHKDELLIWLECHRKETDTMEQ